MSKPANYDEQLKYYTDRYDEVAVVSCDNCKSPLAFEVKGGIDYAGDDSHPEGRVVIPVSYPEHPQGMALMSWRARLDGQIGYHCGALVDNPKYAKALAEAEKDLAAEQKAYTRDLANYKKLLPAHDTEVKKVRAFNEKLLKDTEDGKEIGKDRVAQDLPAPLIEPTKPELRPITEPTVRYCNTSTILAEGERGRVPSGVGAGGVAPVMAPFDKDALRAELADTKPDVEINGKVKRIEKFKIERIK